jgi:hypothetical protein
VNGQLTGEAITLPVADPNTEVSAALDLDVTLDPNAIVRWKVTEAPSAELTAWHVTLALTVAAVGT